jgi:threonine/homoserine/homoserine lactone efflux protein
MIVEIIRILIDGLIVGLASSVTVGPVAVLCIQRTLSRGYLSGIFSGLGVASADTLMAILAFTLYALLKSYIDQYNTIIMSLGGVFVIIVGIFIFFKNPVPQVRKNRTDKNELWQDFASMFGFTLANFAIIIPYILAFFTMFNVELSSSTLSDKINIDTELLMDKHYDNDVVVYNDEAKATDLYDIIERNEQRDKAEAHEKAMAEVASELKVPRMIRNILVLGGFLLGAMVWWVGLTSLINLFRRNFRPRHLIVINRIAGIIISALGAYTLLSVIIKL